MGKMREKILCFLLVAIVICGVLPGVVAKPFFKVEKSAMKGLQGFGKNHFSGGSTEGVCYGDLNNDNVIDGEDLNLVVANFGVDNSTNPEFWNAYGWRADINQNQVLDLPDLSNVLAYYPNGVGTRC